MKLLLELNKMREMRRNIYNRNQINQTLLAIDFDLTYRNDLGNLTYSRFGISINNQYLIIKNTFQCHYTRITETIPSFRYDGCQIWKIYIHSFPINSRLLRIVNEQNSSFLLPPSAYPPSVMDRNDGRSIAIISVKFILYFRLLFLQMPQIHNHLM